MKRALIIVCLIAGFTGVFFNNNMQSFEEKPVSNNTYKTQEGSREELYKDIFIAAFNPYIQKAIEGYYDEPLSYGLADVEIIDIKRPLGHRSFNFEIKLQVQPFEGAHNTVGIDIVTINLNTEGINVTNFQHLKDFERPSYLQ